MSLVTVSEKRDRIYPRKFDHEEAQRLRALGWTYVGIAELMGVHAQAVRRVCDPKVRQDMQDRATVNLRKRRTPCRGGCGKLVWASDKKRSGYCTPCYWKAKQLTNPDVRAGELRCTKCRAWKPDDEFPTNKPSKMRRGRNPMCRPCATAMRRNHRHTHKVIDVLQTHKVANKRRRERGMTMQKYVVLEPNGDHSYKEVGRVEAVSPRHAIEEIASDSGSFIAVQETRFTPMRVEAVQAFKVIAEPAGA